MGNPFENHRLLRFNPDSGNNLSRIQPVHCHNRGLGIHSHAGCECGNLENFVRFGFWTPEEKKIYEAIENGFAKNFFNTYDERVKTVLNALGEKDLTSDKALDIIWEEIESELGEKFPDQVRENWKKTIQESWNSGQDYNNPSNKNKVPKAQANKNVIDFINKDFDFSIGKQFNRSSDSTNINEAIKLALAEGSTDRVVQRLEKVLMNDVNDINGLKGKLDYIVRGNILRVRNFSRIERFEAVGITKLEIVAIEDDRTSEICRAMNGKEIEVRKAMEFVNEFTSDDPSRDGFWKDYSNDKVGDLFWEKGDVAFGKLGNKLPPYHVRCRTTIVAGGTTVVTRKSNSGRGTDLEGNIDKPKTTNKTRKQLNKEAVDLMEKLEKSELVNRIDNVIFRSDWNSDGKNLNKHWEKHGGKFSNLGVNSIDEYRKFTKEAIKNFSILYGYIYDQDKTFKFGFEMEYKKKKLLAVVNPVTMEIDSFMIHDQKYKYPRIF